MSPRLLQYSDIENAYDNPERIGQLAGLIDELRDTNTLVVGTGDNTAPGVLAMVTEAEQSLDFFQSVAPDAETFGNHDFDFGAERTRELVRSSPQPWLCANVYAEDGRFGASAGVVPWTILEVGGDRIGLFGVIDPDTPSMAPVADELTFTDPIDEARTAIAELRNRRVDHIVALSHLGDSDDDLAAAVDIDAILGGHIHSERIEHSHETLLTRPGAGGRILLEITLDGTASATRYEVADAPIDQSVRNALRERWEQAGLTEVVVHTNDSIEWTGASVYNGECRIGNFVADAYRWAAETDVGLQNSGGIRAGPPLAGDVTVGDLASVVPFSASVVVAEITGAELREMFQQGDSALVDFGDAMRWYAHISGAEIVYDHDEKRLVEATVDGDPIDPKQTYSVATSEYLLQTDLEFPVLTPEHHVRTLDTQYEVLTAYARETGINPQLDGRITRYNLSQSGVG
jgi:2',3'-cyclic-nucleotide 2'-phosphodiesterase (5'-nucleotidase family)